MTGRKSFRYSVAALLFISLVAAGLLAGYRIGFEQGYSDGDAQRASEQPYTQIHPVADLFSREQEDGEPHDNSGKRELSKISRVMLMLQATITPDYWDSVGGPYTMAPTPDEDALVIHATSDVHEEIRTLLSDVGAAQEAIDDAVHRREETRASAPMVPADRGK